MPAGAGAIQANGVSAGRDAILVAGNLIQNAPAPAYSPLYQLPPPPAAFTGREEDVAELEKQLAAGQAAGAAITGVSAGLQGTGGVGKTALAVFLAHRLKDRYPDAQLFLNLHGAGADVGGRYRAPGDKPLDPAQAIESIIHSFRPEARLPEGEEALGPIYRSVLAEAGRVLIVLDNAVEASQVRPLLPPPNCLLLVTSRARFDLPVLAVRRIDCLPPAKSRELLLKLAPRVGSLAVEGAATCGHLPLALEVFAGAVNDKGLTPVRELLDRLRKGADRLAPVDAAFEVSAALLQEGLRRRWHQLAIFVPDFDLPAAAAVWGEKDPKSARESMQALFNASLVEWNEAAGRFHLHELVRRFCDGKLDQPQRDALRLLYAEHYVAVAESSNQRFHEGGKGVVQSLELFDKERAHIEATFDWLSRQHDQESATLVLRLVEAVPHTGDLRFHPSQQIRWLECQIDAAKLMGDRLAEGDALGNLGSSYFALGDSRKAIECHEMSLAIHRECGDRHGEGVDLGNLGNAYTELGDARKAIEFYEQDLLIARELGHKRGEACALGNLGGAYGRLGDTRKAIEYDQQSLSIARGIGDRHGEGHSLGGLGSAYAESGDLRKANECHEQALKIRREIGDKMGEGQELGNLGCAYGNLGDLPQAIKLWDQQLVIAREIGDRRGEGSALWNSALALKDLGKREEALIRAEAALPILDAIESPQAAMVRAALAEWRGEDGM